MRKKGLVETAERHLSKERTDFLLSAAKSGDRLEIVTLSNQGDNARMLGMGIIPGVLLEVVNSNVRGAVVVALNHQRLALGAEIAGRIRVKPAIALPTTRLQDLAVGSTAEVVGYSPTARPYRRKLLAMGLTKTTQFTIVRRAPLGDPIEIRVRGFSLSLRKAEADALLVQPCVLPRA